jgi:hypothetical protein
MEQENYNQPNTRDFNAVSNVAAGSTVTLIVLNLMGELDWSWRWTLSPIWIPLAIAFVSAFYTSVFKNTSSDSREK